MERSTQVSKKLQQIKNKLAVYDKTVKAVDDVEEFLALVEEENDESYAPDIERDLERAEKDIEELRLQTLLRGKYDACDALITLHAGAGGTEACDWTEMLYRMYICYAEKHGYKITEYDRLAGDEAGIKSVTFKVEGDNTYGYLKAEKGVHRLVRISPFDSNARRHTSFSSVEVMPEIEETDEIVIRPEDLKVDTFRSSGAGGQHVNKTESCIRMTHLPTGIVVTCQDERSQIKNREKALKVLKSRLYDYYNTQYQKEYDENRKSQIGTGDRSERIRTYNFPQGRITDHRIGFTLYSLENFLNGDIDEMIEMLAIKDREAKLANEEE